MKICSLFKCIFSRHSLFIVLNKYFTFEIPEPQNDLECGSLSLEGRDDFKRYRNDYIKPIMFRLVEDIPLKIG